MGQHNADPIDPPDGHEVDDDDAGLEDWNPLVSQRVEKVPKSSDKSAPKKKTKTKARSKVRRQEGSQ